MKTEWPVAAPVTGRVERVNPVPFAGTQQVRGKGFEDDFDSETLDLAWNFRRVPMPGTWSLSDGHLRLAATPNVIKERGRASLMGFRQTESDFSYTANMSFAPNDDGVEAGLMLFQKDNNYLSFTVVRDGDSHALRSVVSLPQQDAKKTREVRELERVTLDAYDKHILLRVVSKDDRYRLSYSVDNGNTFVEFMETLADHILSRGYTGAYLGLYATSNGRASDDYADFDWVEYEAAPRPSRNPEASR